ncbi:ABC transporter permease [Clostridium sp.]|uniref:ABC transporter permease n=1 Tax=Clostridium sp. TaxID=1506 RepID=UPI00261E28A6|nr:ABC transporter permease [Clostridium sp.]
MSAINLIKTAIASLKFHKLRTFLTMIGIIIGISSVVTILSVGDGLKAYVLQSSEETNANKISVTFTPDNYEANMEIIEPFTKSDINGIESLKGVEKAKASQGFMGMMSFSSSQLQYFDKNQFAILNSYEGKNEKVEYGRWFRKGEENDNLIVLEHNTAKELFNPIESGIGKAVTMNGINYEVIGILPKVDIMGFGQDTTSYVSKKAIDNMTNGEKIMSLDISVKGNVSKKDVFKEVNKYLMANHPNIGGKYKMQDPEEITKAFEKVIGGLTKFIAFITGISLLVGGIGVMNIMYVSVSERKREIGIRRAIGAKPNSILLQFLFEAVLVTLLGGLIGILLGYLVAKGAGAFMPFKPILTLSTFTGATIISIIEGIIFGIIPAYNACKLDPIKAIYR